MLKIKLKEVTKSKGYTLTDIAQNTGISMNTLSVLGRNGSKGIQFDTLEKICVFLGCTPNDLIKITSDNYVVQVALQAIKSKTIHATATKYSVLNNSMKNNIMYNADKEDISFYVTFIAFANNAAFFLIDYSTHDIKDKIIQKKVAKSKEWLSSLDEENKISICKQAIEIYLKSYWNDPIPINISVSVNDGNNGNLYSFKNFKNGNKVELNLKLSD